MHPLRPVDGGQSFVMVFPEAFVVHADVRQPLGLRVQRFGCFHTANVASKRPFPTCRCAPKACTAGFMRVRVKRMTQAFSSDPRPNMYVLAALTLLVRVAIGRHFGTIPH